MIRYNEWQLLNENIGAPYTLGLKQRQNLGLARNKYSEMEMPPMGQQTPSPDSPSPGDEMGMPKKKKKFGMDMLKKKKKKFDDDEDMDMLDKHPDDDDHDDDDDDDDDMDLDHDDDDDDVDPDSEFEDDDEEDSLDGEDDEDDDEFMKKKKSMMGRPNDSSPFMKESKKVTKNVLYEKGNADMPEKKCCGKMMKKKMSSGVCKKCKCEDCKCDNPYLRKEKGNSYDEWVKSIINMYGDPFKKHSDGIHEDILLPPENEYNPLDPQPGQPGWGPQTRIGDQQSIAESVSSLMKKIKKLEKKLKNK